MHDKSIQVELQLYFLEVEKKASRKTDRAKIMISAALGKYLKNEMKNQYNWTTYNL